MMTQTQFAIVQFITDCIENGAPPSSEEIASACDMHKYNIEATIDRLVERGLVERHSTPHKTVIVRVRGKPLAIRAVAS